MTRTAIIVSLFTAFAATACALDDSDQSDDTANQPGVFIWVPEDIRRVLDTGEMLVPDYADTESDDGLCACTTPECEQDYVEENWGCGVCVDAVCGDGHFAGGCVPCEQDIQQSPAPLPWQWVGDGAPDALEITDEMRLQGGWTGYLLHDQDTQVLLEVSGSNYSMMIPRFDTKHAGRLVIDTTTAPSRITTYVADSTDPDLINATNPGVYQLDGKWLMITVGAPNSEYPADLSDDGTTYVFYRK